MGSRLKQHIELDKAQNNRSEMMSLPFVTALREAPQDNMFQCAAHHECPHCHADMMIAGRYDKSDRTVEGISKPSIHDCYQCGKRVIPQLKGVKTSS